MFQCLSKFSILPNLNSLIPTTRYQVEIGFRRDKLNMIDGRSMLDRVKFVLFQYTVVGPNNESKITKKIRYFTPLPKNNEITNSGKYRYLSENLPKISSIT